MSNASISLTRWKFRHAVVTWIGSILNACLGTLLLVAPEWTIAQMQLPEIDYILVMLWGGLMITLGVFYIPMAIDIDRYRAFCWLSILPSRLFGCLFFILAVVLFQQPAGFLLPATLDGAIALAWLHIMIKIVSLEQAIANGRG